MDHSSTTEQRRDIEEQLRAELEDARATYCLARAEAARLEIYYADLGIGHRDGSYAIRKATNVKHRATEVYREALVKFNRFILDGKLPDD
jgi:hypothetical protein